MKIAFSELHGWEDGSLRKRVNRRHEAVVFTLQDAFNSQEALERILDTTVDNIASFVAGAPKNVVN